MVLAGGDGAVRVMDLETGAFTVRGDWENWDGLGGDWEGLGGLNWGVKLGELGGTGGVKLGALNWGNWEG